MVSNDGFVKRISTGKILKFGNQKRYYTVALHSNGQRKDRYVHRLVAIAFIPQLNSEQKYVNHKDHDIHNNNVENLEWCTSSENARHSYENDRRVKEYQTVRNYIQSKMVEATKKSVEQWTLDGQLIAVYCSGAEASRQTGISAKNISRVLHQRGKTAGGYKWKFHESSTTKCSQNPSETAPDLETKEEIV